LTILTETPPHAVQTVAWAGRLVPAHNTSSGRALLMDLERDELERRFAGVVFGVGGPNAPRDLDELYQRILVARRAGYAIVDEEFEPGLVAAAAPVRDFRGGVIAALNVSAPKFRLSGRLPLAAQAIKAAAEELSAQMGWDGARSRSLAGRSA
jgi:DNA-binding IclR family transcriptional regulator